MPTPYDDRAARAARRAASTVSNMRDSVTAFRDPVARLRRQQRRARWGIGIRAVPTAGVAALAGEAFSTGADTVGVMVAAVAAAGVGATGVATRRAWRLHRVRLPEPTPPVPPGRSAARPAILRLAAQERALAELLPMLGGAAGDTSTEAASAARALRQYAARVVAVEAAGRSGAGGAGISATVGMLVGRLTDGVDGYERLVTAAAQAVAAGQSRPDPATSRQLEDATDRLAGLASGLRELDGGS